MDDGTVQATFCATLVDEWVRGGLHHAVVCPGSRSTPLAIALSNHPSMDVLVHPDERSASFLAIGISLETHMPTVLLTTSGTAAAELHPAVIEASLSCVPLLVCTADRPPELIGRGAPQAIDQTKLYGSSVRWFHDPGVPDLAQSDTWRSLASKALLETLGHQPGPVHLNLPFRDPLVGTPMSLPEAVSSGPWQHRWEGSRHGSDDGAHLASLLQGHTGVIVAGAGSPPCLVDLADKLGWPILADARSNLGDSPVVLGAADAVLRSDGVAGLDNPSVVLRVGEQPSSRIVWEWAAKLRAHRVHILKSGMPWLDAAHDVDLSVSTDSIAGLVAEVTDAVTQQVTSDWLDSWQSAEQIAQQVISEQLATAPLSEPAVARQLTAALAADARLVVSSSMPIRDVDWYAQRRSDLYVHANRGANGIDGVVSTAVGVALASKAPTALLIGDIALLHDSNGLIGAAGRKIDLLIVVIDNDGGGIFSMLPQHELLENEQYEELFGTPTGIDPCALLEAYGIDSQVISQPEQLDEIVAAQGVRAAVVRTHRGDNLAFHRQINEAVAKALSGRS